ncbi:3'-5' exonuclease [Chitinophagaceae bacterium MMS25-I14]
MTTGNQLSHILFIDIETVPCTATMNELNDVMLSEWQRKSRYLKLAETESPLPEDVFMNRSGIFSEFAKVVCIGVGCLVKKDKEWNLLLKSLSGNEEKILLKNFSDLLIKFAGNNPGFKFCGHNIKEFDIPFLCRRMVINGVPLPPSMQLSGKKPWENPNIDTLELWRFGDHKHYTSLALLAEVLGIPSPKDDMDGSMVSEVFWKEGNLERISTYCLQDVATTAKVYLRLAGQDIAPELVYVQE